MGISPPAMAAEIVTALSPMAPPVAGAIVGALISGAITRWVVQRHWVRRTSESALIDSLMRDLDAVVEKTLEYWSLDYRGDTKKDRETCEKARGLAAQIKAAIYKLQVALRQYSERYCRHVDFVGLMGEVQDACTNGDFDSARRGPDHGRYKIVVNATTRVRSALFERRV